MVFGRVLRPPSYSARLAHSTQRDPLVAGRRRGDGERQLRRPLRRARGAGRARARRRAKSSVVGRSCLLPATTEARDFLPTLPSVRSLVHRQGEASATGSVRRLEASYSKPYMAHASIGPSCALARCEKGKFTIWSHTQGSHHLQRQLAQVLGVAAETLSRSSTRMAPAVTAITAPTMSRSMRHCLRAPADGRCGYSGRARTSSPGRRTVRQWWCGCRLARCDGADRRLAP